MLKDQYSLIQTGRCKASGNFIIIENLPQISQVESLVSLNKPTELNCGQFIQTKSCFLLNCCSCRTIKELTLNLYGQTISKSHIQSCINIFPCLISQQLIITTLSGILIGKVKKQNCFNKNILTIYDAEENVKYLIERQQFSCGNLLPRFMRCCKDINYEIMQAKSYKSIGSIVNKIEGCLNSFFSCLDSYQIHFPKDVNDKHKILLLNALVYLDIVKHQFF